MPINYLQVDPVMFSTIVVLFLISLALITCALCALFPQTYKKTYRSGSMVRWKAASISNKHVEEQKN